MVRIDPEGVEAQAILSVLDFSGKRVLEAGCGTGWLAKYLQKLCHEYVGIDINEKAIERAQKTVPNATFRVQDFFSVNEKFDVIIGVRFFHEVGPDRTLLALYKALDLADYVIMLEPLPGGEVERLYDICEERKGILHDARLLGLCLSLFEILRKGMARIEKIRIVRVPWYVDSPEDVAKFIVKDEKCPDAYNDVLQLAKKILAKHPGVLYDESVLVVLSKLTTERI